MRLDSTPARVTRGIEPATANRSPLLFLLSNRVSRSNVM